MQQAIDILDEMINEPEIINWAFNPKYIKYKNVLREAKARIQALQNSKDDRFKEIVERKSESAYHRWWKEWQAKAMEAIIDFEKNKLTPNPIIISKSDEWLVLIPWKTYYIWDNKTPAVALFPRFQYSNWTIDTIHHTNIREVPPIPK